MPNFTPLQQITVTDSFTHSVSKDIAQINLLIDQYNKAPTPIEQFNALQKIYLSKRGIDNKYGDKEISKNKEYQGVVHDTFFEQLKSEYKKFGINSLLDVTKIDPSTPTLPLPQNAFSSILANMAPEKTKELLKILSVGGSFNKNEFLTLYKPHEEGFLDYQNFLATHSIQFLGGGNSKNFKITPNNGSAPYVLKVDNRLGMPKSVEEYLRQHSLQNTLTPVYAERQTSCTVNSQNITRTLLITDFCKGGDIETYGRNFVKISDGTKSALNIYGQMGAILLGITQDGCAFPDMKNSNWLIDPNGTVRLADTKSFVPVEPNGIIDLNLNKQKWFGLLQTRHMSPPEFYSSQFSADKMHSFMLGKNLYQYLTDCTYDYLASNQDSQNYDFSNPVFNTEDGKKLKYLIERMIKPNPIDRISINEALLGLETIECTSLLNEIQSFNVGPQEKEINQFIINMQQQINSANNRAELHALKEELSNRLIPIRQINLSLEKTEGSNFSKKIPSSDSKTEILMSDTIPINKSNNKEDMQLDKNACIALLKEIKSFNLGKYESDKDEYIVQQQAKLNDSKNSIEIKNIKEELQAKVSEVKQFVLSNKKEQCHVILKQTQAYAHGNNSLEQFIINQVMEINNAKTSEELDNIKQRLIKYNLTLLNKENQPKEPIKDDTVMKEFDEDQTEPMEIMFVKK